MSTTIEKGRDSGKCATPTTGTNITIPTVFQHIQKIVTRLALWGLIPAGLALRIIEQVAQRGDSGDNIHVPKTTGTGFGDPESKRRTTAPRRYFYVRMPSSAFYGRALAGIPSGMPGSVMSGSPTSPCVRPPHLAMGSGVTAHNGGHDMAALPIPAHSAHTFPLTEKSARRAARQWFTGAPAVTLATWRDDRCRTHCNGLPENPARAQAFHDAFAAEIGNIIAGGRHE